MHVFNPLPGLVALSHQPSNHTRRCVLAVESVGKLCPLRLERLLDLERLEHDRVVLRLKGGEKSRDRGLGGRARRESRGLCQR